MNLQSDKYLNKKVVLFFSINVVERIYKVAENI